MSSATAEGKPEGRSSSVSIEGHHGATDDRREEEDAETPPALSPHEPEHDDGRDGDRRELHQREEELACRERHPVSEPADVGRHALGRVGRQAHDQEQDRRHATPDGDAHRITRVSEVALAGRPVVDLGRHRLTRPDVHGRQRALGHPVTSSPRDWPRTPVGSRGRVLRRPAPRVARPEQLLQVLWLSGVSPMPHGTRAVRQARGPGPSVPGDDARGLTPGARRAPRGRGRGPSTSRCRS